MPRRRPAPMPASLRTMNTTGSTASIRVGVVGAAGRMGSAACAAIAAADDLELVAAVVRAEPTDSIAGVAPTSEFRSLVDAGCDVVVDLSTVNTSRTLIPFCALHGVHLVVGTTGFEPGEIDEMSSLFADAAAHCVFAPNFAISAVLMMRFAELAAPYFDTAEIIEIHHDAKADAPSGTAVATADMMRPGSAGWAQDPTRHTTVEGARGGRGPNGVHIHSVRMRGAVAHQEVILGTTGQTLTIRQDSYDRSSFMPGVLLACRRIADHPGVTVGLHRLL